MTDNIRVIIAGKDEAIIHAVKRVQKLANTENKPFMLKSGDFVVQINPIRSEALTAGQVKNLTNDSLIHAYRELNDRISAGDDQLFEMASHYQLERLRQECPEIAKFLDMLKGE